MKLQLFYLLSCSFIYLSKSQDIIKATNYTIDYLETVNTNNITCQSDADCPEYSKCEKNSNGKPSFCKFGSFLCPKKIGDYLEKGENNKNCVFINSDIWDLDKEEFVKNANVNQKTDIKPILKICPKYEKNNPTSKCETDKCNKDEDCFSGKCRSNQCIVNDKVNHYIYRCTGVDNSIKCGKQLGMECGSNEDCYSGGCYYNTCVDKKYMENDTKKTNKWRIFLGIVFLVVVIPLIFIVLFFLFLFIKLHVQTLYNKCVNKIKERKREKERKMEEKRKIERERKLKIEREKEKEKEKEEFYMINIEN